MTNSILSSGKSPLCDAVVSNISSKWSLWGGSTVKKEIQALSPAQLESLVTSTLERINISEIERLADLIPLPLLEKAAQIHHPLASPALESAREMYFQAREYLQRTTPSFPSLSEYISWILNIIYTSIDSIITAFGIGDFFANPEDDYEERFKSQRVFMLLSLFSLLSTTLLPLIEAVEGAKILATVILSICGISIVYPYVKPSPNSLPLAENWTLLPYDAIQSPLGVRQEHLDHIACLLTPARSGKRYPMLIGQSGVGKTETIKAFAKAVALGKYPHLKGKQVFYINTAELVNSSETFTNGNKALARIRKKLGNHKENAILVFDEIHLACQKERSILSDQLKRYLDPGDENLPYLIGITTEEEYFRDIFQNHTAFARRFKTIPIENTTPKETLKTLQIAALVQNPGIPIENGALNYLYEKSSTALRASSPQPITSLQILSQCIEKITERQKSTTEKKIDEVRQKIEFPSTRWFSRLWASSPSELQEKLNALLSRLAPEKNEAAQLNSLSHRLAEAKNAMFRTILKVSFVADAALQEKNNRHLSLFLLLHRFLIPELEKNICALGGKLGLNTTIQPALIDEVIKEELETRARAKKAIKRGQTQALNASVG